MNSALREHVRRRAGMRCEYCLVSESDRVLAYHVEHIIARKHGGADIPNNLCYSCRECNHSKGSNLAGFRRGQIVVLFNPRRQSWNRHFRWSGPRLVGRTLIGKVTVNVLNINDDERVKMRAALMAEGRFPPANGND